MLTLLEPSTDAALTAGTDGTCGAHICIFTEGRSCRPGQELQCSGDMIE
jgi:hypothetical protein